jgi:8-oxo-dGTP diphosphatase
MTDYVLGFRFSADKKEVVLIEKLKPKWQAGKFNGVGGKVEESDQIPICQPLDSEKAAMAREFEEETGVVVPADEWQYFGLLEGGTDKVHVFWSVGDISECHTMEAEEVYISSVDPLPDKVIQNLRWMIPMMLDDSTQKPGVFKFA